MSDKKLLQPTLTARGGRDSADLASEPEPNSDSDWLSDTASRTRSPFQEDDQDSKLGVGFVGGIRRKLKVGGSPRARGRGSAKSDAGEYKVYLWRWFMLGTLTLLNLSNGMV